MKKIKVKVLGGSTCDLSAVDTWVVYWQTFKRSFGTDSDLVEENSRAQVFIEKQEADKFAKALYAANQMIGNGNSLVNVRIKKQKSGL